MTAASPKIYQVNIEAFKDAQTGRFDIYVDGKLHPIYQKMKESDLAMAIMAITTNAATAAGVDPANAEMHLGDGTRWKLPK